MSDNDDTKLKTRPVTQTEAKINYFAFKLFLDFLHRNCDNTNVKHVVYIHNLLGIYWLFTLFTGYEQVKGTRTDTSYNISTRNTQ